MTSFWPTERAFDMGQRKYIAKVTPAKNGGFLGEVVEVATGKPAGLSSRTEKAIDAAGDALHFADALNNSEKR